MGGAAEDYRLSRGREAELDEDRLRRPVVRVDRADQRFAAECVEGVLGQRRPGFERIAAPPPGARELAAEFELTAVLLRHEREQAEEDAIGDAAGGESAVAVGLMGRGPIDEDERLLRRLRHAIEQQRIDSRIGMERGDVRRVRGRERLQGQPPRGDDRLSPDRENPYP